MPPFGRAVTPMVGPCGASVIDCSGWPASCCSGGCCSTPIMVRQLPRRLQRSLGLTLLLSRPAWRPSTARQRRPRGHEWHRRLAPARSLLEQGATLAGEDKTRHVGCLTAGRKSHSSASLYEAFPPEEAKRLADRLEMHHTPKHGSWLNQAEIELSVLARQCLARRIAHQDTLKRQIAGWAERRNVARPQIKWQFTTQDARIKLRSLYPSTHA